MEDRDPMANSTVSVVSDERTISASHGSVIPIGDREADVPIPLTAEPPGPEGCIA